MDYQKVKRERETNMLLKKYGYKLRRHIQLFMDEKHKTNKKAEQIELFSISRYNRGLFIKIRVTFPKCECCNNQKVTYFEKSIKWGDLE